MLISFETPEIRGKQFRDELGRFTTAGNNHQYAANRRLAEDLRAQVGYYISEHVASGRYAAYSTGNLEEASASPQNARVELFRVAIGNPDWLDRRAAYWRTFEYGSAATWHRPFIGTPLIPVRGRPLVTATGPRPAWIRPNAYIVKKEIDPADIYGKVVARIDLTDYALQMARNYLNEVFSGE